MTAPKLPLLLLTMAACSAKVEPKQDTPSAPVPRTKPVDWSGSQHDSDKVPVQVVTLADGHAFFVVGTDTAAWPPLVWLFDVESGKWVRQHGAEAPR